MRFFFLPILLLLALPIGKLLANSTVQTLPACEALRHADIKFIEPCSSTTFLDRAITVIEEAKIPYFYTYTDGILHMAYLSDAAKVELCCDIQIPMISYDTSGLWHISLVGEKLRRLELELLLMVDDEPVELGIWSGPESKSLPAPCEAKVEYLLFEEKGSQDFQSISLYVPEGVNPDQEVDIIYMADGEAVEHYASFFQQRKRRAHNAVPIILVGLWSAEIDHMVHGVPAKFSRSQEYLFRAGQQNHGFLAHNRQFLQGILRWIEQDKLSHYKIIKRFLAGHSDGAVWAIATALKNPDFFDGAIGISTIFAPIVDVVKLTDVSKKLTFTLFYGSLEASASNFSNQLYCILNSKGHYVQIKEIPGGHSTLMWSKAVLETANQQGSIIFSSQPNVSCSDAPSGPKNQLH